MGVTGTQCVSATWPIAGTYVSGGDVGSGFLDGRPVLAGTVIDCTCDRCIILDEIDDARLAEAVVLDVAGDSWTVQHVPFRDLPGASR